MSEDARRERRGRLAGMLHSWYCSRIQEEIEIFLDTLMAHMQILEVHPGYWLTNLLTVLDEESLKFQVNLLSERKKDFAALCHTLLKYYRFTTSYYRIKRRDLIEI